MSSRRRSYPPSTRKRVGHPMSSLDVVTMSPATADAKPPPSPPPRHLSPLIPAILLPLSASLIVHAQVFSTTTPPYMNVPLLPQHVQSQLVVLLPPTAFPALEAS